MYSQPQGTPGAETPLGDKALIQAAKEGQKATLELLIARDADVNLRNRFGESALEAAEANNNTEIAGLLRAQGARVCEWPKDQLRGAIERGDLESFRAVLEKGASPDACVDRGEPALTTAVRREQPEIAKLLLAYGAQTDAMDRGGKTALMRAAGSGEDLGGRGRRRERPRRETPRCPDDRKNERRHADH